MNIHSRMIARLKGTCFITVDGDGNVTGSQPALTARAGEDPTAHQPIPELSSQGAPRDPAAPPETEAEKATRIAKERESETPEQKTTREAAEAKAAEDAAEVTRRAALTDEQRTAEDAAKASQESDAANKAWAERDKSKDVPVTPEQKADIAKLAKTPEQVAAMEEFTLETNTTNNLSPASRAKAAELWGVTPDMVDRYVASVIAQNKSTTEAAGAYDDTSEDQSKWSPAMQGAFKARMDALEGVAGGSANWLAFAEWANQSLNAEQKSALQAAISASPIVGATVAKEFIAKWKAEGNGGGPADLSRGAGMQPSQVKPGVQPFASRQEQNAAINDPRYSKDAAYRTSVDQRIVASNFASSGNVEKSFYEGTGRMM